MTKKIKILQIGAGSMGTRRLRDLSQRNDVDIAVFDLRNDRREKVEKNFSVPSFDNLEDALSWNPEALIISTPPEQHKEYIRLALDMRLHHFCEEHIWTYDCDEIELISSANNLVSASSCSFHFLPIVIGLKKIVKKKLGNLHCYQMLLSTCMRQWHPEEGSAFYARKRQTAAAREMVPFELIYLNDIFGQAHEVSGMVGCCGDSEENPEDIWNLQMRLQNNAYGQLTVLQGAPANERRGLCIGENGKVVFDIRKGTINLTLNNSPVENLNFGTVGEVIEDTYNKEINTFVEAVKGKVEWPLSYQQSSVATATLAAMEKSAITGKREMVDYLTQPAFLPCDY